MPYQIEVTDTFNGEANYCWVKRGSVTIPDSFPNALNVRQAQRRRIIAAVRKVAGWSASVRVSVDDYGDDMTIRPRGLLQVAFVSWSDEETEEG